MKNQIAVIKKFLHLKTHYFLKKKCESFPKVAPTHKMSIESCNNEQISEIK